MLRYLVGDVINPSGTGYKIIPHVVNSIGAWGRGFVLAISKKWWQPEHDYREWSRQGPMELGKYDPFTLGNVQFVKVESDIQIANMLAQNGLRGRNNPRPISYSALATCMKKVATKAKKLNASIHAPRFGAGLAGGDWETIEQYIIELWVRENLDICIYDLPKR